MPVDSSVRAKGIGGTDISAILGMNPWRSAWDVYAEKRGLLAQCVEETEQRMKWGSRLESAILDGYEEETGRKLIRNIGTLQHPSREFMVWSPDAIVQNENGGVDAKNVGIQQYDEYGEPGTDQIPRHYRLQGAWYMAASGAAWWDFAVLFGGNDLRIFRLQRDLELEAVLLEAAERFWTRCVIEGREPKMMPTSAAARYLKAKFPEDKWPIRDASEEERALLLQLRDAHERFDAIEAECEALELKLKSLIGEDAGIQAAGIGKVTWKRTKDIRLLDWEAAAKWYANGDDLSRFAVTSPGYRRFLTKWTKEKK